MYLSPLLLQLTGHSRFRKEQQWKVLALASIALSAMTRGDVQWLTPAAVIELVLLPKSTKHCAGINMIKKHHQ